MNVTNNKVALVLRAFLPAVFMVAVLLMSSLWDHIVYGGFDNILSMGYDQEFSYRFSSLFVPFAYIASPLFIFLHYFVCMASQRINMSFQRICIFILGGMFMGGLCYWMAVPVRKMYLTIGVAELFFKFGLPLMLYFYLLQLTRMARLYKESSRFAKVWFLTCDAIIVLSILVPALSAAGIVSLTSLAFYLYPLSAFAWFGLFWMCQRNWLKLILLAGCIVHLFFLVNWGLWTV